MKVLLDSNVIIAAFAARGLCLEIFEYCLYEQTIVLSLPLLEEIERNLHKKVKVPKEIIDDLKQFFFSQANIVEPEKVSKNVCRDASDFIVLGTAAAGRADFIVTGDEDLLVLGKYRLIPILSPRKFWEFLQKK